MPISLYDTTDESIRSALIKVLKVKYKNHNLNKTAIIPELALPRGLARIDIAVINGIMHGYELKSDFDSLNRLTSQIEAYNLIFDKVTLVVGKKHIIEAINTVPDWWGIVVAQKLDNSTKLNLLPIREAKVNPKQDIHIITRMLWKQEALNLLTKKNITCKKNFTKESIYNNLIEGYDVKELKGHVRKYLIKRFFNSDWRVDEELRKYGDWFQP